MGKKSHLSEQAAFGFLNLWRKKEGLTKDRVQHRPYECHFCGQWHIGKKQRKRGIEA